MAYPEELLVSWWENYYGFRQIFQKTNCGS